MVLRLPSSSGWAYQHWVLDVNQLQRLHVWFTSYCLKCLLPGQSRSLIDLTMINDSSKMPSYHQTTSSKISATSMEWSHFTMKHLFQSMSASAFWLAMQFTHLPFDADFLFHHCSVDLGIFSFWTLFILEGYLLHWFGNHHLSLQRFAEDTC